MGCGFSCCRRRKRVAFDEQEPLLKARSSFGSQTGDDEPQTYLDRLADILAALKTGKLPDQEQVTAMSRAMLQTEFLKPDSRFYMDLSDDTAAERKALIVSIRDLLESVIWIGLEKNDDNRIQDLVCTEQRLNSVPVDVSRPPDNGTLNELGKVASAIPSEQEIADDTRAFMDAMRTLASLVLTSSVFRLILSDLFLSARQFMSGIAQSVKSVAQTVENVADAVDERIQPSSDPISFATAGDMAANSPPVDASAQVSVVRKTPKEALLDRLELIIAQAQGSPKYNAALRTLLFLLRKYVSRVQIAATAASNARESTSDVKLSSLRPIISPDPNFSRALEHIQVLLERFASGKSLDPVINALFDVASSIGDTPDHNALQVRALFEQIGSWLDRALASPDWANSRVGRKEAEQLYDQAQDVLQQDGAVTEGIHRLLELTDEIIDGMKSDNTTLHFVNALSNVSDDFTALVKSTFESTGRGAINWRINLMKSIFGWAVPKLLRAIRVVPMPRVEYMNLEPGGKQLAVAVDALILRAQEELVPDELRIMEWGEMKIELGGPEHHFVAPAVAFEESVSSPRAQSPPSVGLPARAMSPIRIESPMTRHSAMSPVMNSTPPSRGGIVSPVVGTSSQSELEHDTGRTKVTTVSRVRVHASGLRIAAYDIGYFAKYRRFSWLGYEDEGLMSAIVGTPGKSGDGLQIDIELELEAPSSSSEAVIKDEVRRLFKVIDVTVDLPGLTVTTRKSRHWLLNFLLTPFVGPVARMVGSRMLASQAKMMLESLEVKLRAVKNHAKEAALANGRKTAGPLGSDALDTEEVKLEDWWAGFLEAFGGDAGPDEDDNERETYEETHTSATTKGFVRTTYSQPEPEPAGGGDKGDTEEVGEPSQTVLAVGMGSQLLGGKGEPLARESVGDVVSDVGAELSREMGEVQERLVDVKKDVEGGVAAAAETRRQLNDAGKRAEVMTEVEGRRSGWRSRAFDLHDHD